MSNTVNSQIAITSILAQNPELAPEIDLDPSEFVDGSNDTPRVKQVYGAIQELIKLKVVPEPALVARKSETSIQVVKKFFENNNFELENLSTYLGEIRSETFRNEIKKLGLEIAELADEKQLTDDQIMFDLQQKTSKIKPVTDISFEGARFGNVLDNYLERVEREKDLPIDQLLLKTPFDDYNHLFGGMYFGDYTVIAGQTGMGKTAYTMDIVLKALEDGRNVISFILEMSEEQMTQRQISKIAKLSMKEIREYSFFKDRQKKFDFFQAIEALQKYRDNWFVFGTETNNFLDIVNKIKKLNAIKPIHLIVVDYLQLVHFKEYQYNRTLEVGMVSQGLAALAKQTNAHIIATAQLNRENLNTQDKRPQLNHLKDSSLIEQSSDGVEFLFRPGYFDENIENPNIAELHRAKGRNTGTGRISLYWDGEHTAFRNLAKNYQQQYHIF